MMGAAKSHLEKFDRVQRAAERIGRFKVESLESRREAAAMSIALKLLDDQARGVLKKFIPKLTVYECHTCFSLIEKDKSA